MLQINKSMYIEHSITIILNYFRTYTDMIFLNVISEIFSFKTVLLFSETIFNNIINSFIATFFKTIWNCLFWWPLRLS